MNPSFAVFYMLFIKLSESSWIDPESSEKEILIDFTNGSLPFLSDE